MASSREDESHFPPGVPQAMPTRTWPTSPQYSVLSSTELMTLNARSIEERMSISSIPGSWYGSEAAMFLLSVLALYFFHSTRLFDQMFFCILRNLRVRAETC